MPTIHVKNLEKYQPKYKDGRRLLWIRWDIDSLSDYRFTKLTPEQRWLLVGLTCLEVKNQNPLPWDEKWIAEQLGFTKNHISKHLLMLQTLELLVTDFKVECKSSSPTDRQTENTDRDVTPLQIYDHYAKTIKPGAKEDAIKNIVSLLKTGVSKDDLLGRINAYKAKLTKDSTEPKFYIQANNFFGKAARYKDFEPIKIVQYTAPDPNCKACNATGKLQNGEGQIVRCGCVKEALSQIEGEC
jgi:hypothetical protein